MSNERLSILKKSFGYFRLVLCIVYTIGVVASMKIVIISIIIKIHR